MAKRCSCIYWKNSDQCFDMLNITNCSSSFIIKALICWWTAEFSKCGSHEMKCSSKPNVLKWKKKKKKVKLIFLLQNCKILSILQIIKLLHAFVENFLFKTIMWSKLLWFQKYLKYSIKKFKNARFNYYKMFFPPCNNETLYQYPNFHIFSWEGYEIQLYFPCICMFSKQITG